MKSKPERNYLGLLWTLAGVGTLLDQASKYTAFRWLFNAQDLRGQFDIIPGVFKLFVEYSGERQSPHGFLAGLRTWSSDVRPHVNPGALFGWKGFLDHLVPEGQQDHLANGLFAAVSIVAALAILYWSTRGSSRRDLSLCAALGLILAGTLGNLFDRLIFGGVRDFLYFYWINWPIFNIADCCLVCGASLLLLQAFLSHPVPAGKEETGVTMAPEMAEAS